MRVSYVGTTKVTSTTSSRRSVALCLASVKGLLHIIWLVLLLLVRVSVAHAATDNMVLPPSSFKYLLTKAIERNGGPARTMAWIFPLSSSPITTAMSTRGRHKSLHGPGARHGSTVTTSLETERKPTLPRRVAIVGGGLAGLSTAYHLLQKTAADVNLSSCLDITILDPAMVGMAGASSVAGGLLHPLSPRGKLVPLGLEGLASTSELLRHAVRYQPDCILRDEIFRIALTDEHMTTLQETARQFPDWSEWISQEDLPLSLQRVEPEKNQDEILVRSGTTTSTTDKGPRGALRLFSGCQVIHVPSYLKGLWSACLATVAKGDKTPTTTMTAQWLVEPELTRPGYNWKQRLSEYDTVVFAAGAGLFQDPLSSTLTNKSSNTKTTSLLNLQDFPATLVRGQSIELTLPQTEKKKLMGLLDHAILCGKYVSPLPAKDKVLIGATHEFQSQPLSKDKVENELKERSYDFASQIWDTLGTNPETDRVITSGVRVQSNRGKFGRMPMIGLYDDDKAMDLHHNAWLFTGLSSRGLLYHGVMGDILTDQMLQRDGIRYNSDIVAHINWWKQGNPIRS